MAADSAIRPLAAATSAALAATLNQYSLLAVLILFLIGSVWLGAAAQRRIRRGAFLQGFFLGNRGLGAWAMALTATVQSGGTFMGFPSLVYSHGWVVAWWIAGYMVLPVTAFAVVGKRLAQLSRRSGAITVPDLLTERFGGSAVGLVASLLIVVFMTSMMIAQFKAGSLIMQQAWPQSLAPDATDPPSAPAPSAGSAPATATATLPTSYYVGLVVFTVAVVGYTMIGGFLASVWTDLFQSVMMLAGVLLLLLLVLPEAGGLHQATLDAVEVTGRRFATAPGYTPDGRAFLTPGLACSFFVIWVFSGFSLPPSVVRVMATESTQVLRRSIVLLTVYNILIYIPLIFICIAGRALIPNLQNPDEIIPRLAIHATADLALGRGLSGLILAAPFGAVMATVSSYLLVIASGLVKDLYLRFVRPEAPTREVQVVTYLAMALVGLLAIAANIHPVKYLQALVVFSGASAAATFVTPVLMACYWRRATAPGVVASMLAGAGTMFGMFALGWVQRLAEAAVAGSEPSAWMVHLHRLLGPDPHTGIAGALRPYFLWGLDPVLWAMGASALAGVLVSLATAPPDPQRVTRYFAPRCVEG